MGYEAVRCSAHKTNGFNKGALPLIKIERGSPETVELCQEYAVSGLQLNAVVSIRLL
jgi:hypothetical protein